MEISVLSSRGILPVMPTAPIEKYNDAEIILPVCKFLWLLKVKVYNFV